jgi:hypothetical protein
MDLKRAYSSFDYGLIISLLLLVGLGPAIHYFIPIKVLEFSFFSTLLPFILLSFLYLKNVNLFGDKSFLLFIFSILFLVLLVRLVLYGENFLQLIKSTSYFLYITILFSIFKKYEFTAERRKNILHVVTALFLFHSLNSIFFLLGLPHIAVVDELSDDYVAFSRFTGIFGGANVQANFNAILFIILLHGSKKQGVLTITFFAVLAILGIVPTVSRGGLLLVLLNLFIKYYQMLAKASFYIKLVFGLSVVLYITTTVNHPNETTSIFSASYLERLDDEDFAGSRIERLTFTFDRITENNAGIFIGIPKIRQTESKELNISDNSGTLVLANTGLVFFMMFFGYIINNFKRKHISSSNVFVFIISLMITTFTNNAFLYFQWCIFAICGYYLIVSNIKVCGEDI